MKLARPIELTSVVMGLALLLLLAGCAQHVERVVLLPPSDGGGPGAVAFTTRVEKSKFELSQPYEVLNIGVDAVKPGTTTEAEVRRRYGKIIPPSRPKPKQETVAVPAPEPKNYLLYFRSGKTELTPQSQTTFEMAKKQIMAMPAADVVVIGHTDRAGSQRRNDALSLQRARWVQARLIAEGIPKDRIEAVGRGERDPLIQTADGVAEPQNRRVEIRVR